MEQKTEKRKTRKRAMKGANAKRMRKKKGGRVPEGQQYPLWQSKGYPGGHPPPPLFDPLPVLHIPPAAQVVPGKNVLMKWSERGNESR